MTSERRKQEMQAAYDAGYQAFSDGVKVHHNSAAHSDKVHWLAGWRQAEADREQWEAEEKDEQLRAKRISGISLGADKQRRVRELCEQGVPRLIAVRSVKRDLMLEMIAHGDETELRRVVAELVRRL